MVADHLKKRLDDVRDWPIAEIETWLVYLELRAKLTAATDD